MQCELYGILPDGEPVYKITLGSENGLAVDVITYGAIITNIWVTDRENRRLDIALGFDTLQQYIEDQSYIGSVAGSYCGRIADAAFSLNGKRYTLSANNGRNCLHGGFSGLHKKVWKISAQTENSVTLKTTRPAGEDGFPGNLNISLTYQILNSTSLRVEYTATTDAPTHINLTQHTYFNLSGNSGNEVLDHDIQIESLYFLPQNDHSIPTGELYPVRDPVFDLRSGKKLATLTTVDEPQFVTDRGVNHTFVLDTARNTNTAPVCKLHCQTSGIQLELRTSEPGLHLYCANYLDGSLSGKHQQNLIQYGGVCLETQHFPDTPNQPHFPSTRLDPGTIFQSFTEFSFTATPPSTLPDRPLL